MSRFRRLARRLAAAGALALALARPAAAQDPQQLPFPGRVADSTQLADSLRRTRADSVDATERFLRAQAENAVAVPVVPRLAPAGPRPATSRVVFTRDSLDWATAETVSDIISRYPGVYVWRGGWIGRDELVSYQGRGSTSVEYVVDGVPFVPVGPDSVAVDPALFPMSFFERVELEPWPGLLRVYLFTRRHGRLTPATRVGIASGDGSFGRFSGAVEKRWRGGPGFQLAGELLDAPTRSGRSSDANVGNLMAQVSYLRSPRLGVLAQLMAQSPTRDAYIGADGDTLGQPLEGRRNDLLVRAFTRARDDGLGLGLDVIYAHTSWSGQQVEQGFDQVGAVVGWRQPTLQVTASAFRRSRWTSLDGRATAGWSPVPWFTLSGEGGWQQHDGDRRSRWLGGRAGVRLPLGFDVAGSARVGSVVAAPSQLADTAQEIRDLELTVGWERRFLGVRGGVSQTAAFQGLPFFPFRRIPQLAPAPRTNWLVGQVRISPTQWLSLEGWLQQPRNGLPDGQPPDHVRGTATIRSKFLPTFRSGIFDLKLQVVGERWGRGVAGRLADGTAVPLPAGSFVRTEIEMQLGSFMIFWDRINLAASRDQYVPGFSIPVGGNLFGVRWDFLN